MIPRPSKRWLANLCPSSTVPPKYELTVDNYAARFGKAAHEAVCGQLSYGYYDPIPIAEHNRVNSDELEDVSGGAAEFIAHAMPSDAKLVGVEQTFPPVGNDPGGTADAVFASPDGAIYVIDWKSGFRLGFDDARAQLLDYCRRTAPTGKAIGIAVNLRTKQYVVHEFTAADFDSIHHDNERFLAEAGKKYNPGDHCAYCPARNECGARTAAQHETAVALIGMQCAVTPVIYARLRELERAIDAAREQIREAVMAAGGQLGDLELREYKIEEIDPQLAWPVLKSAGFSDADMAAVLTVRKTAVNDKMGDKYNAAVANGTAKPRQKAKTQQQLMDALRQAGAVTVSTQYRLHQRRGADGAQPLKLETTND